MRCPLFSLAAQLPSGAPFAQDELEQLVRIVIPGPEFADLIQVNCGSHSLLLGKLRE
jgi:hypothetical protein